MVMSSVSTMRTKCDCMWFTSFLMPSPSVWAQEGVNLLNGTLMAHTKGGVIPRLVVALLPG